MNQRKQVTFSGLLEELRNEALPKKERANLIDNLSKQYIYTIGVEKLTMSEINELIETQLLSEILKEFHIQKIGNLFRNLTKSTYNIKLQQRILESIEVKVLADKINSIESQLYDCSVLLQQVKNISNNYAIKLLQKTKLNLLISKMDAQKKYWAINFGYLFRTIFKISKSHGEEFLKHCYRIFEERIQEEEDLWELDNFYFLHTEIELPELNTLMERIEKRIQEELESNIENGELDWLILTNDYTPQGFVLKTLKRIIDREKTIKLPIDFLIRVGIARESTYKDHTLYKLDSTILDLVAKADITHLLKQSKDEGFRTYPHLLDKIKFISRDFSTKLVLKTEIWNLEFAIKNAKNLKYVIELFTNLNYFSTDKAKELGNKIKLETYVSLIQKENEIFYIKEMLKILERQSPEKFDVVAKKFDLDKLSKRIKKQNT